MKQTREYKIIMNNLNWCIANSEGSFATTLANALRTRNPLLLKWIKEATGKKEIYVGGDWLQVSEQCKEAIIKKGIS